MTSVDRPEELRTKVHGERVIYDSPQVKMSLAEIEPPDGRRFEHHLLRLPPVAIAIVLNDADEVLMLCRHRWVVDSWGWELPGGIIDHGEDGAAAAAREVEEETGWRPGQLIQMVTYQVIMGMADARHELYVAHGATRVGEPSDLAEAGRVEWVPIAAILGLIEKDEVQGSGSLVGLLHLLAGRNARTAVAERPDMRTPGESLAGAAPHSTAIGT